MPELQISGYPTPEQAAAIVTAVERFIAETTPASAAGPVMSGWQRTALREGIGAGALHADPWGEPRGWAPSGPSVGRA